MFYLEHFIMVIYPLSCYNRLNEGTRGDMMQLDIYAEPLICEDSAKVKKEEAYKKFHASYEADWIRLDYLNEELLKSIESAAKYIRENFDAFVVIGIGGSFIGAKAFIDALGTDFPIYFAGNNLDSSYIASIMRELDGKRYAINVISKSGTTMETKLVFDIFYADMLEKGVNIKDSIYVTSSEGTKLDDFAKEHGMKRFTIAKDIGGRYSVFTAVGLLAMAVAGLDIHKLIRGIKDAKKEYYDDNNNAALDYAYYRHLASKDYALEFISVYMERLAAFAEWIKQLLCESLAKDGKGLIVSKLIYTQDLHSMGQLLQEGRRNIIETHIYAESKADISIPCDKKLSMNYVNETAFKATVKAHHEGGVPTCVIKLDELTEESLARLSVFYMCSCVYNAALDGVEPYGQAGVEVYKKNIQNILKE